MGVEASRKVRSFRTQLIFGVALAALPPLAVVGLYWYGSSTGCSGGDCTGPMMGVMMLGLIAVPMSIAGILYTVVTLAGELFRRLRSRRSAS